jgi:hypothetical protein
MTIQAPSIRTRRPLLVACIALVVISVVAAALAYAWRRPAGEAQEGHDLAVYGPQASGVIGFNRVHRGTTYRFAFPVPRNKTDQAIKLTGAAVQTVPAGAQVLGYPIYSLDEVGDYLLNYDDSDQVGTVSLQKVKDYAGTDITIPPHSDSKYFVMVAVKVIGPVTQPLRGCTFDYTLGSHKYRQSFPCEFQLGESP